MAICISEFGRAPAQDGGEVACWGGVGAPGVLSLANASAVGGRVYVSRAASVCVGVAFVGVLLSAGRGALVVSTAVGAHTLVPLVGGLPAERLWCGGRALCAASAGAPPACYDVGFAADGRVPLSPSLYSSAAGAGGGGGGGPPLAMSIGAGHACALEANGSVPWCAWANGTRAPTPPHGTPPLLSLAAGAGGVTCGVALAPPAARSVVCWGPLAAPPVPQGPEFTALAIDGASGFMCGMAGSNGTCGGGGGGGGSGGGSLDDSAAPGRVLCYSGGGSSSPLGQGCFTAMAVAAGGGVCGVRAGGGNISCVGGGPDASPACGGGGGGGGGGGTPGHCYGLRATAVDGGRAEGVSVGDLVELALSRSAAGGCG